MSSPIASPGLQRCLGAPVFLSACARLRNFFSAFARGGRAARERGSKVSPMGVSTAPSALQFLAAEGHAAAGMSPDDYMDFAERYADFVAQFEQRGGDLGLCELWPLGRVGRWPARAN